MYGVYERIIRSQKGGKMKLKESKVIFNQKEHTYHFGDKQLSGVTSLLNRQLFKDKYIAVSDEVLQRAAQRGSMVHETIELVDSLGVSSELEEVKAYIALKEQYGLTTHCNEYLVSDNDHVASSIDIVFDDCSLADIKTTSKLDKEYVRWQLSVYAYLFELQNPRKKAGKLYAIWLPKPQYGNPALVEVERIPSEVVAELIACDKRGEQFMLHVEPVEDQSVTIAEDVVNEVIMISKQMKEMEQRYKELQSGLLQVMKENNVKSYKNGGLMLIYKEPTTRKSIDTKALESKYPEIYSELLKESTIKESLTIKIS